MNRRLRAVRVQVLGDLYQCVFVFTLRDGLIAKEIGYRSKPFPAPEWRVPWVERITG